MFKHFENHVPAELQQKLFEIVEEVNATFFNDYCAENFGEGQVEEISGIGYSGFIPLQDGGFSCSVFCHNSTDSTYDIHPDQSKYNEKSYQNMLESFAHDCLEKSFSEAKEWAKNLDWQELSEETRERLYEYETEWFEPALLRFEIWVDRNSRVFWRLSANFRDAPYYRSSMDSTICEGTLAQESVLNCNVFAFLKLMKVKADKAWEK